MWEYLTVFALAATPLVELLVVIPVGIGFGLNPAVVAVVAAAGNALPILLVIALYDQGRRWWHARRHGSAEAAPEAGGPAASRRGLRARRLWERYGTPGLALLAPLVTGVHIAAIVALALGSPSRRIAGWLMLSIGLWSAGVTVLTVLGLEGIRLLVRPGSSGIWP
jgi:Ca2+/H+ antiporter, TMEM165/GDT1 family